MKDDRLISAIIVDDDPLCGIQIRDVIAKYSLGVEVKAICNNRADGLVKIKENNPELVFLNVEMKETNTFDMIRELPVINFEIIFMATNEYYTIRAIRLSALDYLVKPIEDTAFKDAINRLIEKRERIRKLPPQLAIAASPAQKKLTNLAIPVMDGLLFINLQDIIWCESVDKYTKIYLTDRKNVLASRTLGDFEDLFLPHEFFRIHKCYLVNLKHMKKYIRGDGGQVIMTDGATLEVSRRRKDELLGLVSKF